MIPGIVVAGFIAWACVMALMIAVSRKRGHRLGRSGNCADAETTPEAQAFLDYMSRKRNELRARAEAQRQTRKS